MDHGLSDSSGTDDDLPPPHQNRGTRGRIAVNGRTGVALPYARPQLDMETQIHQLEQEAYSSVLRAFKAQSDLLTWEKETLITELRTELKVSDMEHRELLSMVNADDLIRRIREWRQAGGRQPGLMNHSQPVPDSLPSPSVSGSRKRKNTSQSIPSLPINVPSPAMHSQPVAASMPPSVTAVKHGLSGTKGKQPKPIPFTGQSERGHLTNRGVPGVITGNEQLETGPQDPLVGRKVMTRWPEDNNFYEAVITDYDKQKGLHVLVYDINTNNETWEWVNLKEISPEDIRWEGEDPSFQSRGVRGGGAGRGGGIKKAPSRNSVIRPGLGRGRGPLKHQSKKDLRLSQNGIGKRGSGDIEILNTESLLKEVERIFSASHSDPVEVEKAKKVLKEHEQALIDAIARLADASDGESADCDQSFP
ncbi:protein EMSY-LIKE 3 [Phalaenopsis equestris]|uniref:protein EMSY-LIKE 3 n=1 Tax=Phalaenopsis equestris TaxID=78828 RepID=UPI0009E4C1A8|nr:protein EMSY-LIKE 3 [Phalaenopsis equestris]